MVYADRKYLSILTLTEDRNYATCDELIRVLEERPSDAVYIERDGILCGLITCGHIERRHDAKTRRVPFSKKFTFVHPEEYLRVKQIFKDKINIRMLPVVTEDGHLLGEYERRNDLVGIDYAESLCKDPYVLQELKKHIQDVVFVKPAIHGSANKDEMFLRWRQTLKREEVHLQVIQPWEVKDYLHIFKYFLFVDEKESKGIEALNRYLSCNKTDEKIEFMAVAEFLYHMRELADLSFLKELQNQDVFIMFFDFVENNNQFLAAFKRKIQQHNAEYGIDKDMIFSETWKESFFGELYCGTFKKQEFPVPISFHTQLGLSYMNDMGTEFFRIQNGERLTVNQPEQYDRCIYMYGPCIITGTLVPDQYTISSLLQDEINQAGFSCKVVNRGFPGGFEGAKTDRVQAASYKRGDIIVLDRSISPVDDYPILNLTDALEKYDTPAGWFATAYDTNNYFRHSNHKANQIYAHEIYKELIPVLQQPPKGREPVELNHDYIDRFYLRHYFSDFDPAHSGTVGAIVMNCNPFTFGHRFLIEKALNTVDFLIIFVVEEDESLFSFQERFAMVCQGTSDLERVMVVPSGPYILSKNTFPEYFQKIDDEDLKKNTEDDITLFAEKIAPKLGITYRFVGEEREDEVTNEYNEAMKRILPHYGIQVVEIPRKTIGQSVISASRVRHCLSMNQKEELDGLVPASTKRILFYEIK